MYLVNELLRGLCKCQQRSHTTPKLMIILLHFLFRINPSQVRCRDKSIAITVYRHHRYDEVYYRIHCHCEITTFSGRISVSCARWDCLL